MSLTDAVNKERIKYFSNTGLPLEEIILLEVESWLDKNNDTRNLMKIGLDYYKGDNLEIESKDRYFIGKNGLKIRDNENRRNNILKHNFFKKLVNQKVGYLFSKGLKVTCKDPEYEKELKRRFNPEFNKRLANTGRSAIINGIAWWQLYYEKGKLKTKTIPSHEVIPLWSNSEHTSLDAVIRVYDIVVYVGNQKEIQTKVEYYDTSGVKRYIYKDNKLIKDIEAGDETSHFIVKKPNHNYDKETDSEVINLNWEKVPFVYFKYNEYEIPLIKDILSLQDDYNRKRSEFSDILSDAIRAIFVVKDYDGQDLAEFNENIFKHFAAKTSGEGGLDTLDLNINTQAHESHIEQVRKDIYEFGRGVDVDTDKFGNSPSGIALKILYNDLDMDANDFISELRASLNYLLYFINLDIAQNPNSQYKKSFDELNNIEVEFIFDKNMLINDKELIDAIETSSLSEKTKIERNPYAAKDELLRVQEEKKENFADLFEYPPLKADD